MEAYQILLIYSDNRTKGNALVMRNGLAPSTISSSACCLAAINSRLDQKLICIPYLVNIRWRYVRSKWLQLYSVHRMLARGDPSQTLP